MLLPATLPQSSLSALLSTFELLLANLAFWPSLVLSGSSVLDLQGKMDPGISIRNEMLGGTSGLQVYTTAQY